MSLRAGEATAVAHPNIALAKYWGKRPGPGRFPAVPSLSVTLEGMRTITSVRFDPHAREDELVLGGAKADEAATRRAKELLDLVRGEAGLSTAARVESRNDFPTASGLASSASAFAAMAVAARAAAGLPDDPAAASDLARRISVSAARSVFGGFVELPLAPEGEARLAASPLAPASRMPLRVVVAVTREGPKEVGSTEGMLHTMTTSPFYEAWLALAPRLFERARSAVLEGDLDALGASAEQSALAMHASSIAASPGLVYWTGATVEGIAEVRRLRARGLSAFVTIDAGPHVKVLTHARDEDAVAEAMAAVPGVLRVIRARPGEGARLEAAPASKGAAERGAGGSA